MTVTLKNIICSDSVKPNTKYGVRLISDAEIDKLKLYKCIYDGDHNSRYIATECGEYIYCVGDGTYHIDGDDTTRLTRIIKTAIYELFEDEYEMIECEYSELFVKISDLT